MPKPPPGSVPGMVPPDVSSMMAEGMMQKAQQQKTNIQQAAQQSSPSLAQQTGLSPFQGQSGQQGNQGFQHQHKPRDLGSFTDEAKMAVSDIAEGVMSIPQAFLDMLGLKRPPKTPEEQAKLQQFHQRYQQQTQEVQQITNQRVQAETQRKKAEEEQKEMMKKQQEEQKKAESQSFIPHGKVSGQAALDKMQQDRKGMGGASG